MIFYFSPLPPKSHRIIRASTFFSRLRAIKCYFSAARSSSVCKYRASEPGRFITFPVSSPARSRWFTRYLADTPRCKSASAKLLTLLSHCTRTSFAFYFRSVFPTLISHLFLSITSFVGKRKRLLIKLYQQITRC